MTDNISLATETQIAEIKNELTKANVTDIVQRIGNCITPIYQALDPTSSFSYAANQIDHFPDSGLIEAHLGYDVLMETLPDGINPVVFERCIQHLHDYTTAIGIFATKIAKDGRITTTWCFDPDSPTPNKPFYHVPQSHVTADLSPRNGKNPPITAEAWMTNNFGDSYTPTDPCDYPDLNSFESTLSVKINAGLDPQETKIPKGIRVDIADFYKQKPLLQTEQTQLLNHFKERAATNLHARVISAIKDDYDITKKMNYNKNQTEDSSLRLTRF